jgi:hypothetical protein
MGAASIGLYVLMNYVSAGSVIYDAVSALGMMIAFYYGLTGFACAWYYRRSLRQSARNLWVRGILPALGGLMMYGALVFSFYHYWNPKNSYTSWRIPFAPHWHIGGIDMIDILAIALGIILMTLYRGLRPAFFRGEVLNRSTPTLVPEDLGAPVGLFGVDEEAPLEGHPLPVDPATAAPPATEVPR